MGTKMAPPYANVYMSKIEKELLTDFEIFILLWKRFIDDILFIWSGTLETLKEFITLANTFHPTIKFTFEYSYTHVNFLDTTIYLDKNRKLQTTIYRKPTDKNLILHYDSCHPPQLKRNIVYTQALKYKRIISNPARAEQELATLKEIFLARGYPHRLIQQQLSKAILIPRASLLKDKSVSTKKILILKVP